MNADEQLHKLKQDQPLTKEEKRKKVITAIVLAVSTLISVLFLIFAFMQKMEADKLKEEAVAAQVKVIEVQKMAEAARKEADLQRMIAEKNMATAMEQKALAAKALEDCKKSKR